MTGYFYYVQGQHISEKTKNGLIREGTIVVFISENEVSIRSIFEGKLNLMRGYLKKGETNQVSGSWLHRREFSPL